MEGQIKTAITATEWKAVGESNEVAKALKQVTAHTQQVLDGHRNAMFVFGGSGLGKNHIVQRELDARKLGDVQMITPKTVNDLLHEFHKATHRRKKPLPMVFDEARLIFDTDANLDVMKLATDTAVGAKRFHTGYVWFSEEEIETDDGELKIKKVRHQGTSLKAAIIAMTNKNLNQFDKKTRDSVEALLSRVPPIMIPDDPLATWEYVIYLALTTDLITHYKGQTLPLDRRAAITEWFSANLYDLKQISVRTLLNIRDAFASSPQALLESDLGLLLRAREDRSGRPGPGHFDFVGLRKALN